MTSDLISASVMPVPQPPVPKRPELFFVLCFEPPGYWFLASDLPSPSRRAAEERVGQLKSARGILHIPAEEIIQEIVLVVLAASSERKNES